MTTYFVLDAEYRVDTDAHARYLATERHLPDNSVCDRKDPRTTPRWPFHTPVVASWLVLDTDEDGVLKPTRMVTAGKPEMEGAALLRMLFAELAALGEDAQLVTWGGVPCDLPQLLLAAMGHGLTLPPILRAHAEAFNMRARRHIDLMLLMAGGGARVHLAEVAAALGIPAKPIMAPTLVAGEIERGRWPRVKSVCESDVFSTALILARQLQLTTPGMSVLGACDRIAAFAARMEHRPYAVEFRTYRDRLIVGAQAEAVAAYKLFAA